MRRIITLLLLLSVVAIPLAVFLPSASSQVYTLPSPQYDDSAMVVIYRNNSPNIDNCLYHLYVDGVNSLIEYDGKYYIGEGLPPVCNDASNFSWITVPKQGIGLNTDCSIGMCLPIDTTMGELNLTYYTTETLPHSQHIAWLKSINPESAYPAIVTRLWMGKTYDINCLVSQSIVELYAMDKISVGDYVIVSFIDEHPYYEARSVPILVDKVYKSW